MAPTTLVSKLKVHLKLSISRLRMLQQKSTAIAKQQRRAMAELLGEGKLESARIRVENIIRSDITTELHEILELYCELLLARIQLLEQPASSGSMLSGGGGAGRDAASGNEVMTPQDLDPGLDEAIRSIMYTAPRTDIKELSQARLLFVERFGKDYALECFDGKGVPERVLKRVRLQTPDRELVDAYLREIGRTYGVKFPGDPDFAEDEEEQDEDEKVDGDADDDDDEPGSGGAKAKSLQTPIQAEELSRATPPREIGDKSPLRIAPPSPSTENVAPEVKLPGPEKSVVRPAPKVRKSNTAAAGGGGGGGASSRDKATDAGGPGGKIPDVDELAKRFAALKRG